ncbi:MAG: glutamate-5-semialdehyde dehydrogenase, partial [Firmicutes bacterium]|nr:glutamate-5-semialdehyde dehydrogenase [Bacillota bacterium]
MEGLERIGSSAKAASRVLAAADTDAKNKALYAMADALEKRADEWLAANARDLEAAKESGMSASLTDRLTLTKERIAQIAKGIREVAELEDPIGEIIEGDIRPNGLLIKKCRVPLGVIAIIFEARPNVAADSAALCLKSGNACILRGGKEAINSNICAAGIMRDALEDAGLPRDCICLIEDISRESAKALMHLDEYVDVLIPRGGPGLIRTAVKESSVPVIKTGEGVCHEYVDKSADLKMAAEILFNA